MEIRPTREEFLALAARGTLVPLQAERTADLETPVSAYLKIASRYPTDHFLLESVEGGENWARYSFIGYAPHIRFEARGGEVRVRRGDVEETLAGDDPLALLQGVLGRIRVTGGDDLPRLAAGAVGFIGYDYARRLEPIPSAKGEDSTLPEALFLFPGRMVVFDNVKHRLILLAHAEPAEGEEAGEAWDRCAAYLAEAAEILGMPVPAEASVSEEGEAAEVPFEIPRGAFSAGVERAREYIRDGDIIQVVLSNRARVRTSRTPAQAYRVLRAANPSPYMFLLRSGSLSVVGSSPEVLVRLEGDRVQLRPIAGTRPRGATPEEDRLLETELLTDPKEIAEHVMLVDLGRNDAGRVSEWGSVKVDELMVVERYSHVMHIVSGVSGRLREGKDAFDVLRAAFPAGTVTGAPKVRAMQIIDELEPWRRGIYAGAVGYFDLRGSMDFCIAIRTLVMDGDEGLIQAGAGIVADSDPDREWEEIRNKAGILFRALGAVPAGDGK
jgi:anthranilate synthase component 1